MGWWARCRGEATGHRLAPNAYVRGDAHQTTGGDKALRVIALVGADGDPLALRQLAEHDDGRLDFGVAVGTRHRRVDDQAVAILDQQVRSVTELRLAPRPFLREPGVGIGRRLMRSFRRVSPRKFTSALPPGPPRRSSSRGRKLFWLAAASNKVPSTVKCSFDSRPASSAIASTSRKNAVAMSPVSRRSRRPDSLDSPNPFPLTPSPY